MQNKHHQTLFNGDNLSKLMIAAYGKKEALAGEYCRFFRNIGESITTGAIILWIKGKCSPNFDTVCRLSELFTEEFKSDRYAGTEFFEFVVTPNYFWDK